MHGLGKDGVSFPIRKVLDGVVAYAPPSVMVRHNSRSCASLRGRAFDAFPFVFVFAIAVIRWFECQKKLGPGSDR